MSHTTVIKSKMINIDSLEKAAQQMGFTAVRNGNARVWAGQTERADLVIQLPGRFDLGVRLTRRGAEIESETLADYYDGTVQAALGDPLAKTDAGRKYGKLMLAYNKIEAVNHFASLGYGITDFGVVEGTNNQVIQAYA